MEYSLHALDKVADLKSLKLSDFIDQLNLIGFEVDEIYNERLKNNKFIDNTRLLIKIPPNREDLLCEKNFLSELSTIFSFNLLDNTVKLKNNYNSIIKQKYLESSELDFRVINSNLIEPLTNKNYDQVKVLILEVENFQNFQCPLWIQNKLANAGLSYKNTIDDLISLVKLEWGQSINCLNLNQASNSFSVEQLKEPLIHRDGKNNLYKLTPGTLVLKDQKNNIISVLGLFNSSNEVSSTNSKTLLLECIYYNIHSNDLLLNPLDNKISLRYLRNMSLTNFNLAFERLITLLELTSNGKFKSKIYLTRFKDNNLKYFKTLSLRKSLLEKILNIDSINLKIFNRAGLTLKNETNSELIFSIPISRNDLIREIDLVEEYSRFIGYKNFKPILPVKVDKYLPVKTKNINLIKQIMLSNGFQEIVTNPLHDITRQRDNSILIQNPLNQEFTCLRLTLIDKLISTFETNLKFRNHTTKFFEIGRVFKSEINNKFKEIDTLGCIFQVGQIKKSTPPNREWLMAKGFIENLLLHFGYKYIKFEKIISPDDYFHPTKTVLIKLKDVTIGTFGEINPKFESAQYSKFPIYIFELNLGYLTNKHLRSKIPTFQKFSKYPSIIKDISFVVPKSTNFYTLKTTCNEISNFVKYVEFFDIYFEKSQQNFVNIGLRLNFQSQSSTFTTELIDQELDKVKKVLISDFKAKFK